MNKQPREIQLAFPEERELLRSRTCTQHVLAPQRGIDVNRESNDASFTKLTYWLIRDLEVEMEGSHVGK